MEKKENTLFFIFIVVIVCALLVALYMVNNMSGSIGITKKSPTGSERGDSSATLVAKLVEVPALSDTKIEESSQSNRYHIEVHYPVVTLAQHDDLAKDANTVIRAFASDTIESFKKDVVEMESPNVPKDFVSDLSVRWSTLLVSPTIISIRFDESAYIAGSAHPNNQTRILNYDMERHLLLQTGDLFASSTLAIPFLADYSKTKLTALLNDESKEIFNDITLPGITPTTENFSVIGITKEGLLIVFPPCQVAPCSSGTIHIPIPRAELSERISPRISEAISMSVENIVEATPEESSTSSKNGSN